MAGIQQQSKEVNCRAELGAFDAYLSKMTLYLNPAIMLGKFLSHGVIDGNIIHQIGTFISDADKMDIMLREVRRNIGNGNNSLSQLIEALSDVPNYQNLAREMNGESYRLITVPPL